jgi:hypothetical protein
MVFATYESTAPAAHALLRTASRFRREQLQSVREQERVEAEITRVPSRASPALARRIERRVPHAFECHAALGTDGSSWPAARASDIKVYRQIWGYGPIPNSCRCAPGGSAVAHFAGRDIVEDQVAEFDVVVDRVELKVAIL